MIEVKFIKDYDNPHGGYFFYNPPPSLWCFNNKTSDDLANEISIALKVFINKPNNEFVQVQMAHIVSDILQHWIRLEWLYAPEPIKDIDKESLAKSMVKPIRCGGKDYK